MDCERAFLATLDGNCRTPIAGQAKLVDGEVAAPRFLRPEKKETLRSLLEK